MILLLQAEMDHFYLLLALWPIIAFCNAANPATGKYKISYKLLVLIIAIFFLFCLNCSNVEFISLFLSVCYTLYQFLKPQNLLKCCPAGMMRENSPQFVELSVLIMQGMASDKVVIRNHFYLFLAHIHSVYP